MNGEKELELAVKDVMKIKREITEDQDSSHPLMHVRWVTMDSYVSNLLFVLAYRASGKSLVGHPAIKRLIECRVVLEKIRSLFKKQDKHISRLISIGKAAEKGEDLDDMEETKEMQSNLLDVDNIDSDIQSESEDGDVDVENDDSAMEEDEESGSEVNGEGISDDDEEDSAAASDDEEENSEDADSDDDIKEKLKLIRTDGDYDEEIDSDEAEESDSDAKDDSKEETKKTKNVYRPPKINPVYFDDGRGSKKKTGKDTKQSKEIERRLLQEEKLARLQDVGETPLEIRDFSSHAMKQKQKEREIQKYEEANMIRLTQDRRDRKRHNQMDEVMDLMEGKQDYPQDSSNRKKDKKKAKRLQKRGKLAKKQRRR